VSGAEASLETWSPQFSTLSLNDQIVEIYDHVTKLRAEIATLRAEMKEPPTQPPWVQAQNVTRGDMTGQK